MKYFKKVLCVLVSAALTIGATGVFAAEKSEIVFSDFDSADNWSHSLNYAAQNYNETRGNVFAVPSDAAASTEYNFYKILNEPVSSGKVVVGYDFMVPQTQTFKHFGLRVLNTAYTGTYAGAEGEGNAYNVVGLGTDTDYIGTYWPSSNWSVGTNVEYEANTWYHIDVEFDIDAQKATLYVDGASGGDVSLQTFSKDIYGFMFFAVTNSETTEADKARGYVDNFVISRAADGKYATEMIEGDDGYYLALGETVLNLENISASDISLKNIVSGVEVTPDSVEAIGGRLLYIKASELEASEEYAVETDYNLTSIFGNTPILSGTVNAVSPMQTTTWLDLDFEDYTGGYTSIDATIPSWAGEAILNDNNYKPVTGTDYSGADGTAMEITHPSEWQVPLRFTGTNRPAMDIYTELTLEFDFFAEKTDNTDKFIRPVLSFEGAESWLSEIIEDGWLTSRKSDTSADGGETWMIEVPNIFNQWNTYKAVYTITPEKITQTNTILNADGDVLGTYSLDSVSNKDNIAGKALNSFTLCYRSANYSDKLVLDNMKIYSRKSLPSVKKVRFHNIDGDELYFTENMPSEIDKISISFSEGMSEAALDSGVHLYEGGTELTALVRSYNSSDCTYTIELPDMLKGETDYSLIIDSGVENSTGVTLGAEKRYDFTTLEGVFEVKEFSITKDGKEVNLSDIAPGDTLTVKAELINTTGEEKSVCLSYGVYNGIFMNSFDAVEETTSSAIISKSIDFEVADTEDLSVHGFLWQSSDSMKPIVDKVSLK